MSRDSSICFVERRCSRAVCAPKMTRNRRYRRVSWVGGGAARAHERGGGVRRSGAGLNVRDPLETSLTQVLACGCKIRFRLQIGLIELREPSFATR